MTKKKSFLGAIKRKFRLGKHTEEMTGKFQEPLNILYGILCDRGPAIRTRIEFLATYEQKKACF